MEIGQRIEYLRKEHEELRALAEDLKHSLFSANNGDFGEHQKILAELRLLGDRLDGVVEHCHAERRIIESTYHKYLSEADRQIQSDEHAQLLRAVAEFREELRFATADRITALTRPGAELVRILSAHLMTESSFLDEIEKMTSANSPKQKTYPAPPARAARKKTRKTPRRQPKKDKAHVPYTLEPHPEL